MVRFNHIAEALRRLRGPQKQADFAASLGIPYRTYQNYEHGKTMPQEPVIERICELFDLTREEFLTGDVEAAREAGIRLRNTSDAEVRSGVRVSDRAEAEVISGARFRELLADVSKAAAEAAREAAGKALGERLRAIGEREIDGRKILGQTFINLLLNADPETIDKVEKLLEAEREKKKNPG